jgi:hypothetical protein
MMTIDEHIAKLTQPISEIDRLRYENEYLIWEMGCYLNALVDYITNEARQDLKRHNN